MVEHTLPSITVRFSGIKNTSEIAGKNALVETVNMESADGLKGEISIQNFDNGEIHVRLTEFLTTAPPAYSHLLRNGTMTVQVREDGKWVALLRALRPGGKRLPNAQWGFLGGT